MGRPVDCCSGELRWWGWGGGGGGGGGEEGRLKDQATEPDARSKAKLGDVRLFPEILRWQQKLECCFPSWDAESTAYFDNIKASLDCCHPPRSLELVLNSFSAHPLQENQHARIKF